MLTGEEGMATRFDFRTIQSTVPKVDYLRLGGHSTGVPAASGSCSLQQCSSKGRPRNPESQSMNLIENIFYVTRDVLLYHFGHVRTPRKRKNKALGAMQALAQC